MEYMEIEPSLCCDNNLSLYILIKNLGITKQSIVFLLCFFYFASQIVSLTTWAVSFLMIVPIFLYTSTQQINTHSQEWMEMHNQSSSLFDGIVWENDTTYIWNNRSYSVPAMLNGTDGEEMSGYNNSPVSCNIYWPENEYMNGQAAFTLYTVSFWLHFFTFTNAQLVIYVKDHTIDDTESHFN